MLSTADGSDDRRNCQDHGDQQYSAQRSVEPPMVVRVVPCLLPFATEAVAV